MSICKACNGKGYFTGCVYESDEVGFVDKDYECVVCHGTGQIEQTNEEWLRSCQTHELIRFLLWYPNNVHGYPKPKMSIAEEEDAIREWLKQPHTDKE